MKENVLSRHQLAETLWEHEIAYEDFTVEKSVDPVPYLIGTSVTKDVRILPEGTVVDIKIGDEFKQYK